MYFKLLPTYLHMHIPIYISDSLFKSERVRVCDRTKNSPDFFVQDNRKPILLLDSRHGNIIIIVYFGEGNGQFRIVIDGTKSYSVRTDDENVRNAQTYHFCYDRKIGNQDDEMSMDQPNQDINQPTTGTITNSSAFDSNYSAAIERISSSMSF